MDVDLIYVLDDRAGDASLHVKGELYKYLIRVRHHKVGDNVIFRNSTNIIVAHSYLLESIAPREAVFKLLKSAVQQMKPDRYFHIGWCVIDTKSVEKTLPMLNELGVSKISFIYCKRSQKNFKPDINRFTRILQSSSMQCGRTGIISMEIIDSLGEFIAKYPDCAVLDFCDNALPDKHDFKTILIGCEGGFTQDERDELSQQKCYRLSTKTVLRSETAVVSVAAKSLL